MIIQEMAVKSNIFFIIFFLFDTFRGGTAAFRFCYQGVWHELRETDCPFGLVFNEEFSSPCTYTERTSQTNSTKSLSIWPSICDDVPILSNQEQMHESKIQFLQFGVPQQFSTNTTEKHHNNWMNISHCKQLCSRDPPASDKLKMQTTRVPPDIRTSHEEGDSAEDFPIQQVINETEKMALTDQTLRLGDYLFDEIYTEEANRRAGESAGPDLRVIQLYKKTISILAKTCPDPFIPEDFRNRVLAGFIFLVHDTGIGEIDDISAEDFEEIYAALRACENVNPRFRLEGVICSMNTIATDVVKILPDGEELEASFNPADWDPSKTAFPHQHYDPFVEFAWQAIDVIHGACFATFKRNANMHHKYTSAMERLFGEKIQSRWKNPTPLEDPRMWGTWFLADINMTHQNLGACLAGAYQGTPFAMKLDRPIDKLSNRVKLSTRKDVRNLGPKTAAPETYWEDYRITGGIRNKMKGNAHCLQSAEIRDAVVKDLKESVCSDDGFT